MNIEATKLDKAVVIKVVGRMDAEHSPQFQQACEAWLAQGETHLVLDLAELAYVSSMGLGCFLAVAKQVQAKAGALALVGLHGLPKQVFELTRLIALFAVFESTEQALASFG
jgi:anti-anti-sigma factor